MKFRNSLEIQTDGCERRAFMRVLAMSRAMQCIEWLIMFVLITAGRGAIGETLQSGNPGFGWQWVRNNPLTIQAASVNPNTWDFMEYIDAGFTVLQWDPGNPLTVGSRPPAYAEMSWHGYGGAPSSQPGHSGWIVSDEPTRLQMSGIAAVVKSLRGQAAEKQKLMYATAVNYSTNATNLFGSDARPDYTYSQYLDDFVSIIKPDVLMFDNYPFLSDGTTWSVYLHNLMIVRTKAQANNLPYWGWLQAYGTWGRRMPSESDNRFNVYTHLTMGFTGFSYWAFDYSNPDSGTGNGLLDINGNTTPLYQFVRQTNAEITSLGKSLRLLTSTDVCFLPGKNTANGPLHSTPMGLTNWALGAGGDPRIISATVNTALSANRGTDKDGLIGFFTDDSGQHYFMLTNLYHSASLSASAAALSFVVTFDNTINSIWRLNRQTGLPEEILLSNHTLTWTLPGGTGDLFKYDNRNFAGLFSIVPGDFDGDADVDGADFVVWQTHFPTQSDATLVTGDADGDSDVDGADFVVWQTHFPTAPVPAATTIPEPQSAMLLILGCLGALCRAFRVRPFLIRSA